MKEPSISVGLIQSPSLNFELYGDFRIRGISRNFSGKYSAVWEMGNIKLFGDDYSQDFEGGLILEPYDSHTESFLIKDVTIGVNFHWERKRDFRFLGSLKLIVSGENIVGINLVPLEQYLSSVVGSEMSSTSSLELLKAHAIISRSWVLAQLKARRNRHESDSGQMSITDDRMIKWYDREDHTLFEFCADDHCQRYQGVFKNYNDRARTAVEQTRGLALIHHNEICDARFSKCCGGVSESFENVWQPVKHEYLSSVVDYKFEPENFSLDLENEVSAKKWIKGNPTAFCNTKDERILSQILVNYDRETKDFFRWEVSYAQEELSGLINQKTGFNFGQIKDMQPVKRGKSGRLIELKIVGTEKELTIGKELEIRRILSESHLFSSAFTVETKDLKDGIPGKFVLHGAGWGHGVGLCQIGAAVMGEMGYLFDEILLHYFHNARIEKVY